MFQTHPVLLAILFVGVLVATIRDIQIREVPDTLNYGLITVGILGGLILAILQKNIFVFIDHVLGFLGGLLVGVVMFYGRQWGGGDAKLIMGIGAILGLSYTNLQLPMFLLLLIFAGAIYGVIYTLVLAFAHRKKFLKSFMKRIRDKKIHRLRILLVVTGIVLVAMIIFVPLETKVLIGVLLLGIYLLFYSWIFLKTIEETVLVKRYPIKKLTEGDWVVETIKVGRKVIIEDRNTGITNEQILALKRNKIKTVLVKEGIPFVPGFLIAFLLLMVFQYFDLSHVMLSLL